MIAACCVWVTNMLWFQGKILSHAWTALFYLLGLGRLAVAFLPLNVQAPMVMRDPSRKVGEWLQPRRGGGPAGRQWSPPPGGACCLLVSPL